jgi:hypothetical protein
LRSSHWFMAAVFPFLVVSYENRCLIEITNDTPPVRVRRTFLSEAYQ